MRVARHLVPLVSGLALVGLGALAPRAHAEAWVFKHDQFSSDLATAANSINGGQFYTQPGFVAGEAFGQVYRPLPEMYPLQVTGFDIILAAPPNALSPLYANATIEIYNSQATGADPGEAPIFSISTGDLFNPATQQFGFPLQGNVGIHVDFGQGDPEDRPPMITEGKIWLVVRFQDAASDMSSQWGTLSCAQVSFPELGLETCGCQNVGTVHDNDITPDTNVIQVISPLGQCSGANKTWMFMEDIPALGSGFTIDGDVIMRLHADVAEGPCVAECTGLECGDDGCGGSCGTCTGGDSCSKGQCVSCLPDCLSKQCGDDGCGGTCGSCDEGETCGDDFFCAAVCVPDCDGKECGSNGCGGTCGTCTGTNETCQAGQCVTECDPDCQDNTCGPDGCGGTCGSCDVNESCTGGQCVPDACEPACADKDCGDDGCGGTCGTCDADETCTAGVCVADDPVAFAIDDVSPSTAVTLQATPISITGRGFAAGATVKIGATDCTDVSVTGTALISATVPGLAVGSYSVIVVNPGGEVATLPNGFTVTAATVTTTGNKSDGCAGGPAGAGLALALAALTLMRRRAGRDL